MGFGDDEKTEAVKTMKTKIAQVDLKLPKNCPKVAET